MNRHVSDTRTTRISGFGRVSEDDPNKIRISEKEEASLIDLRVGTREVDGACAEWSATVSAELDSAVSERRPVRFVNETLYFVDRTAHPPHFAETVFPLTAMDQLYGGLTFDRIVVQLDEANGPLHHEPNVWARGVLEHGILPVLRWQHPDTAPPLVEEFSSWAQKLVSNDGELACVRRMVVTEGGSFDQWSGADVHSGLGPRPGFRHSTFAQEISSTPQLMTPEHYTIHVQTQHSN